MYIHIYIYPLDETVSFYQRREACKDAPRNGGYGHTWDFPTIRGTSYTPQCTSNEGHMVFIRWYLGVSKRVVGGAG